MLAEFKRDSARKELETVLQQIHQKRMELQRIEEELEAEEEEEDSSEEDKVKVNQEQVNRSGLFVTQTARNGVMAILPAHVNVTCSFHYRPLNFNKLWHYHTQNCHCNITLYIPPFPTQLSQLQSEREQLSQRVTSLEKQLRDYVSKQRQCEELERQLAAAQEQLLSEQKTARQQLETLKEVSTSHTASSSASNWLTANTIVLICTFIRSRANV